MVEKLNQSLDEIISAKRTKKVYTTKEVITTQRPALSQGLTVQRKVITKPQKRIFARKSPQAQLPVKEYRTSASKQLPVTKPPKQFFTEKYYKEQLLIQQQQEQEELAEKEARQERLQQIQILQQQQQFQKKIQKKLKIENLYHSIDHQELRELFEACGEITKLGILWDDLGYSTGIAIVEYKTEEGAKQAIKEYNEAELDGLILKVSYDSE